MNRLDVNRLALRADPARYVTWPNGGGFQPVEILGACSTPAICGAAASAGW